MNEIETKKEIIAIAQEMLSGKIHLISGCRMIRGLRYDTDRSDDEFFFTFRAVDSETDHFPLGKVRELCDEDYLKRVDKEISDYLANAGEDIRRACSNLIQTLSSDLQNYSQRKEVKEWSRASQFIRGRLKKREWHMQMINVTTHLLKFRNFLIDSWTDLDLLMGNHDWDDDGSFYILTGCK